MFCASLGGTGACSGDSGGGIVDRDVDPAALIGLVSWAQGLQVNGINFGCTTQDAPGVYVRLSRYTKWVTAKTKS